MRRTSLLAVVAAALTLLLSSSANGNADWSWPVRGDVVTKYRNGDDPYAGGQHRGIDIAAPVGTDVVAATAGRVVFTGTVGSSGSVVTLRTRDGRFDLSHLHLSAIAVREGQAVDRGERLGAVGVSGRRSVDRPHLHFGVRDAGSEHAYRDPLDFLPPPPRPAPPEPPAVAPQPAPVAAPPQPAPVPRAAEPGVAPQPVTLPARAPAGATAGAAAPLPVATLADRALPRPQARHTAPVVAAPARRTRPARPSSQLSSRRSSEPSPVRGLGPAPAPRAGAARSIAPPLHGSRPEPGRAGAPGFDAGWLAALIGLVAAATCLGRPDAARRAARGGRTAVGGALRPLLGRG